MHEPEGLASAPEQPPHAPIAGPAPMDAPSIAEPPAATATVLTDTSTSVPARTPAHDWSADDTLAYQTVTYGSPTASLETAEYATVDAPPDNAPDNAPLDNVAGHATNGAVPAQPTTEEPTWYEDSDTVENDVVESPPAEAGSVPPAVGPITAETTTHDSTTPDSTTTEPATVEPATHEPATHEPATDEPATVEPATIEPATVEPASVDRAAEADPWLAPTEQLTVLSGEAALAFRERMAAAHEQLTEAPADAVAQAELVVTDAVAALNRSLVDGAERLGSWRQAEASRPAADVEQLREALLRYRDYLDRLLAL